MVRWEGEGGHASLRGDLTSSVARPLVETLRAGDDAWTRRDAVRRRTFDQGRFGVDPDPYLDHGSIVIAAITSCTNTSNPSVMLAAGLLAKKAVEKGLRRRRG